jgi:hypothetical protein
MSNESSPRKSWTKPKITRLGRLADVAGAQGTGGQAATFKT